MLAPRAVDAECALLPQCCPALQRLYASNNRFADAAPLASCPSLSVVGIHGNLLEDLLTCLCIYPMAVSQLHYQVQEPKANNDVYKKPDQA